MSESILIAILAALGAVSAAVISVTSGRRLKRLVAVSEVLRDLPTDDEARASLLAVRLEDAVELRREQRSNFGIFMGTTSAALLLSIILTIYGDPLRLWSPPTYILVFILFMAAGLLVILLYAAVFVGYSVRLVRRIRAWLQARRVNIDDEGSGTQSVPVRESDGISTPVAE